MDTLIISCTVQGGGWSMRRRLFSLEFRVSVEFRVGSFLLNNERHEKNGTDF